MRPGRGRQNDMGELPMEQGEAMVTEDQIRALARPPGYMGIPRPTMPTEPPVIPVVVLGGQEYLP